VSRVCVIGGDGVEKTRGNKRKRQTFFATCCAPV
jgi:hypothetical protein